MQSVLTEVQVLTFMLHEIWPSLPVPSQTCSAMLPWDCSLARLGGPAFPSHAPGPPEDALKRLHHLPNDICNGAKVGPLRASASNKDGSLAQESNITCTRVASGRGGGEKEDRTLV